MHSEPDDFRPSICPPRDYKDWPHSELVKEVERFEKLFNGKVDEEAKRIAKEHEDKRDEDYGQKLEDLIKDYLELNKSEVDKKLDMIDSMNVILRYKKSFTFFSNLRSMKNSLDKLNGEFEKQNDKFKELYNVISK